MQLSERFHIGLPRTGAAHGRLRARLPDALRPFARRWRLVVAVAVACLAASAASLALLPARYQATAMFLASPVPTTDPAFVGLPVLVAGSDSQRTLATAAGLLRSANAAARMSLILGHGWTATRVASAIKITPQSSSNLISVTGEANSATLASRLTNLYAREVARERNASARSAAASALMSLAAVQASSPTGSLVNKALAERLGALESVRTGGDPTLTLARAAPTPRASTRGSAAKILLLALIFGLAVGGGAAYLSDRLSSRTLADEDEIASLTGLPVLGRVPLLAPRELTVRELSQPANPLRSVLRGVLAQLRLRDPVPRTIVLTSPTRRDGKTTMAVALAIELAQQGASAALLDVDLRAALSGGAGVAPLLKLAVPADLPVGADLVDLAIECPEVRGLLVVPVAPNVAQWGHDQLLLEPSAMVAQALELAEYVVVDTPPWPETPARGSFFELADAVVVLARAGGSPLPSLKALSAISAQAPGTAAGMILLGDWRAGHSPATLPWVKAAETT